MCKNALGAEKRLLIKQRKASQLEPRLEIRQKRKRGIKESEELKAEVRARTTRGEQQSICRIFGKAHMMEKQLIVAVEGTAAVGPFWQTIISDYLDKMIRSFTKLEPIEKKPSAGNWQLAMVVFAVHGSHGACLVRRSGWTRDIDMFFQWLSAIPFSGGGFNDAAVAESLAEALTMFSSLNGSQTQQNVDWQRHCILIAASNPYPLPTPVYHPHMQNVEQSGNIEAHTANRLSDAETVAKEFPQCSVSLSVICPKQLPKLRAIYNAGKRDPQAADPPIDTSKNPNFLVLISENFIEACAAFNRTGMESSALNQSLVEMDMSSVAPVSAPAATFNPAGSVMSQQPISAGNIPAATINMEPTTVTSVTGPALPHIPTARPTSQLVASLQSASPISVSEEVVPNNEIVNETKPILSGMTQPLHSFSGAAANARILNDVAQAQALVGGTSIGLQSMGETPILSNMMSGGISSSIPAAPTVLSSGQLAVTSMSGLVPLAGTGQIAQNSVSASSVSIAPSMSGNSNLCVSQLLSNIQGGVSAGMHQNVLSGTGAGMPFGQGTLMSTPRMTQQGHPGMQPLSRNNSTEANMPLSQQQTSATLSSAQSNYVKVWEGDLSGQRQGEPVLITRLQGFRIASASKLLAANWPQTMQIDRLITQEHLNNERLIGKAEIVVFWAMDQHVFLGQLQEKKFCAVIQLSSQTMILSVSDKTCRLIGMLFPENMVVFKPQIPSQQLEAQHPRLEQLLLQQSLPLLQQQQPLQQLQQQQRLMPLKRKPNIPLQQQPKIPKLHRQQTPQIQQQQQIPQMQQTEQQQPIIGTCLNQASTGGTRRAQLMSQGQASSRGLPNMP
ncbi:mediator of RNA polymerase II transcription subunit 25 isoform X3 [Nicotiana tabacum]|uniref:Mediator of RNA polymerase II transcription subunit 25 n=1 Tax=Nicotiana tabacum TaxID=4097 RepID=A0A1S4ABB5_TOBAC|nr:PREDICTED: mediator of RNA polymerase II transcription subunit 25-like isoform X3 [Nicotiana tabacum]